MKLSIFFLFIIALASPAMAYQVELYLAQAETEAESEVETNSVVFAIETDTVSEIESTQKSFGGAFYFDDVYASSGPLAEAAFLSRSSFVSIGYDKVVSDRVEERSSYSLPPTLNIDAETKAKSLSVNICLEDMIFLMSASKKKTEHEADIPLDVERQDYKTLKLGVGNYLSDTAKVTVSYIKNTLESDAGSEREEKGFEVAAKLFVPYLLGEGTSFRINGSLLAGNGDNNLEGELSSVGLFADIYPVSTLGLSLGYQMSTGKYERVSQSDYDTESRAWTFTLRYFLNDDWSLFTTYMDYEHETEEDSLFLEDISSETNSNITALGLQLRL